MKSIAGWTAAALALALPALADHHEKKGPSMEAFVQQVTDQATKNPEIGEDLSRYMAEHQLDAETMVHRKVTPANVQQYRGKSATGQTEKGLAASGAEARGIIQGAATLVYEARGDAQDPAKKFVAESAGKIVTNLGKSYNEVAQKVQAKVMSIQGKLNQMVAIAIVVNSGGGANGGNSEEAQTGAKIQQVRKNGAVDPGDAEVGQALMELARPEIPLARYGKSLFEQAIRETKEIPELIAQQGGKLNAAQDELAKLVTKEESYRKGMKGMEGAQGTQEVLQGAISALGNHLITVRSAAERLKGFEEGPGRAIEDVLECSLKTFAAGQGLTQNIPDSQQLAMARDALDANVKAARGVGAMAAEWGGLLAWLGNEANDGRVSVPGYESAFAPEAGESKSGDAEKARKRMREAGSMDRRKL